MRIYVKKVRGYDVRVVMIPHKDNPLFAQSEDEVYNTKDLKLTWGKRYFCGFDEATGKDQTVIHMYEGNTPINKTGESKMTTRRTVTVNLYDDSKGIKDEVANVYSTDEVTSETSSERIIQQLLFNESHEISQAISDHNEYRVEQVDLDILQRTGIHVTLRPLEFKDLRWEIK